MTKRQVKQVIWELLRAGIRENLQGRGSNAVRLTPAAVLVVRKECETLSEAKRILTVREGGFATLEEAKGRSNCPTSEQQKGTHSVSIPPVTAAEAHNGLQKALQNLSGVLRRKAGLV